MTISFNVTIDLSPATKATLTTLVASLVASISDVAEAIIDQQEAIEAVTALQAKFDSIDPAPPKEHS